MKKAILAIGITIIVMVFFFIFDVNKEVVAYKNLATTSTTSKSYNNLKHLDKLQPLKINDVPILEKINDKYAQLSPPLIIIRFAESNCGSCVEDLLSKIENSLPKHLMQHVLLIPNYQTELYLKEFYKNHELKYPFINLNDQVLKISYDKYNLPYVFVLDDKSRMLNPFLHIKEKPHKTKSSLNRIIEDYFL